MDNIALHVTDIYIYIYIQINGFLSNSFTTGRVCRQGDAMLSCVFILCVKAYTRKVKNIKGPSFQMVLHFFWMKSHDSALHLHYKFSKKRFLDFKCSVLEYYI